MIISQQIGWDEKSNTCYLYTKYDDGSVEGEPLTTEEAALWEASHGRY